MAQTVGQVDRRGDSAWLAPVVAAQGSRTNKSRIGIEPGTRSSISALANAPKDVGELTRQSGVPALKSGEQRDAKLFHTASKNGRRHSKDRGGTATARV